MTTERGPPRSILQPIERFTRTEEKMTTETTRTPGAFGEVLEELMRSRGLEPVPENIRHLAETSGLDPDRLLRSMLADDVEDLGPLDGLADELSLSGEEKLLLAVAYTYGGGPLYDRWRSGRREHDGR
jgi:hypothetical protein